MSGPLLEGNNNLAPDTAESVVLTAAFPASRSSSPFTSPEPDDVVEASNASSHRLELRRRISGSTGTKKANENITHRVFGSLVSLDDDDPHFSSTSVAVTH